MTSEGHERRFHGDPERLRSAERVKLLEVERVVTLSLEGAVAASILDVGTGTGIFAEAFAARGLSVSAIDANPELIEVAKGFVPEAEFKEGRAEAIPFADGAFDLAFLGHVLHEADDPVAALREASRVSKIRVVVLEWPYTAEEQGPPLEHRLRVDSVKDMAKRAGLGQVDHLRLTHMDLYRIARGA
jgi:ubiquinone/menaquinone biosynthesis C-methylase UbiE